MSKVKILVVGDETKAAKEIRELLEKNEFSVVGTVISGESAIDAIQDLKPDIVLMDTGPADRRNRIAAAKKIRKKTGIPALCHNDTSNNIRTSRARILNQLVFLCRCLELSKKENGPAVSLCAFH